LRRRGSTARDNYALFLCALRTGLRLGELRGLQWGDLDFQHRFIEVRQSLQDGGRVERPKSGSFDGSTCPSA
jgi:integrase